MDAPQTCSVKPAFKTKLQVVTVNGIEIPRSAISREAQNHPAAKPVDAWMAAARALVIRELLLQEARTLRLKPEPMKDEEGRRETDDEAMIRAVVEQQVVTPEADTEVCRRYYTQNAQRFCSPDLFEVSHILIPAAAGSKEDRATAKDVARKIVGQLTEYPERFSSLARTHSVCPSREVDGNLGQIGPGQTVPEFEQALSGMQAGVVHGEPVETRYGLHVVRVDRRIEGRQMPFELVREKIGAYLSDHVRRTAVRQYISMLVGRADITGIDLAGSKSPLVQ